MPSEMTSAPYTRSHPSITHTHARRNPRLFKAAALALFLLAAVGATHAHGQSLFERTGRLVPVVRETSAKQPNVVYFLVDNLGMGELSSYSGGPLRGVTTARIDGFAKEGIRLVNFAPEAQCTPSRSALMTGALFHSLR
jgi:hypothetical protein